MNLEITTLRKDDNTVVSSCDVIVGPDRASIVADLADLDLFGRRMRDALRMIDQADRMLDVPGMPALPPGAGRKIAVPFPIKHLNIVAS